MTREEYDYDNVKKFYQTLKLKDLGELNKIYNFQDTVILCEIFEQRRSSHLQNSLNLALENVIVQVLLTVLFTETKLNV